MLEELLARCSFPPPSTPVTCAFSGGADSTALLALATAAGLAVDAVHVDHGLRPSSTAEAERAVALGDALGVPVAWSTSRSIRSQRRGTARAARRAALPSGALTGHTADDRAETVLINLLRGAGLDGLAAMGPAPTRPLLQLRRHETAAVCAHLGLVPIQDPSNHDPRFVRNRVRHELLPLLDDIAGRDTVPLLVRTATLVAEDLAILESAGAAIDPTDARAVAAATPAVARRALRRWLAVEGYPPDAASVSRVLEVASGERRACELPGGRRVERHRQRLRIVTGTEITSSGGMESHSGQRSQLMATRLRGRWALGITPRNFTWILKDKLAICERPGGYGENHRRVRRQEEIIWIRENGFGCVVSIIPAPHNLHNYEELGMPSRHRPFNGDELEAWLKAFYRELHELMRTGTKVIVHGEEVGDRIVGIMGGYIRWSGLVDDDTQAITVTERLAGRQLDPFARNVILIAPRLR